MLNIWLWIFTKGMTCLHSNMTSSRLSFNFASLGWILFMIKLKMYFCVYCTCVCIQFFFPSKDKSFFFVSMSREIEVLIHTMWLMIVNWKDILRLKIEGELISYLPHNSKHSATILAISLTIPNSHDFNFGQKRKFMRQIMPCRHNMYAVLRRGIKRVALWVRNKIPVSTRRVLNTRFETGNVGIGWSQSTWWSKHSSKRYHHQIE